MIYEQLASIIAQALNYELSNEEVAALLEKPKNSEMGDIAFPCFTLAKKLRKAPQQIASELAENIQANLIQEVKVVGGYVNIFLNQEKLTKDVLQIIMSQKEQYGSISSRHENVVIDYSSPNIAKPFSMGHLRSTVIGNALANISEKNGYKAVKINHLGDWGTQFGKLIVAYRLWGDKEAIESAPIQELLKIYVKFHDMAETDESLNEQARAAFKSLEDGENEALTLWKWFRDASLTEFETIYQILGITFDSYVGEAFYNDKMKPIVQELQDKNLLTLSDGAYVVEMDDQMPPCLITKTDGATLYATRDLAAAIYRHNEYDAVKTFYVVGNEQSLHFKQLFNVLNKMGYEWANELQHVPFGMMLKDGKKMSTRKGKVVLLADVLAEAVETAMQNIEAKNPNLEKKEEVAKQVGVGAVIFNDLKNDRMNDIDFSLEQMMNFEGETGPYVQYTYARISSILEKGNYEEQSLNFKALGDYAWPIVVMLEQFPITVQKAFLYADPSQIAKYSLSLARAFNKYYAHTKVLSDDEYQQMKLAFIHCVAVILKESLRMLGISAPSKM
ncbi:MAG: arginine--tRNA ligase [Candidatus Pristimantibacillus lignocellulolyticus]|uniref:Arginine--tRNA ligase n=1 Tax=Candidatus Pristimantibacillus lignocellulolyticus TaxID=2994561 RepID=A0A9J6ZG49_9BACL|nr:MAG: arginine--tRNA ligase [Candidatus Pristimantibacillus lignocellulolyticus]